MTYNFKTAS